MKNKTFIIILLLLFMFFIQSCEYIEPPPEYDTISGEILLDSTGLHSISLPYDEIKAEITVIGGGGGGGGPFENHTNGTGGGGGGAGEYKVINTKIIKDTIYIIFVGKGGDGGIMSEDGSDGEASYIKLESSPADEYIIKSDYGKKGKDGANSLLLITDPDEYDKQKRNRGSGYESGKDGGGGAGSSTRGHGGTNGFEYNGFEYGEGGSGGHWTLEETEHMPWKGKNGKRGCVIIKYTGKKYK